MRGVRRLFTVATAAAVATGLAAGVPAPAAAAPDPRPNILLITTDDQSLADLAYMSVVKDRLQSQGTYFANSFAPFPLCCPAQATIQTGQYAHNHGVLGNGGGLWPVGGYQALDVDNTLPVWLSAAGYQTAFVGKPMVGYNQLNPLVVPPGWAEWHAVVAGDYSESTMFEDGVKTRYVEYQTDLWSGMAQEILTRRAAADAPLFLWASFKAPHNAGPVEPDDPLVGTTPARAERHKGLFTDLPLPMDASYNEADVSDKPAEVRAMPLLGQAELDYLTTTNQQRLQALQAADEAVAALLDTLEATGEAANTLVLFTSDNGYLLGEHRFTGGKGVPYEPSLRVPLIMRGPGVPAGAVRRDQVATIDLAPTIVDAANATSGLLMDGTSLFAAPRSRTLVIEAGPRDVGGPMYWTGLRTPRWKYVEWGAGDVELYDLKNDPYETNSLHADPRYKTLRDNAATRLAALRDCAGAAECR